MAGTRRCSVYRNSNSDNDWRRRGRILRAYEKEDYDDDDNKIDRKSTRLNSSHT